MGLHQGFSDMKIAIQGPGSRGSKWDAIEHDIMSAFLKASKDRGHDVVRLDSISDPAEFDMIAFMGVKNRRLLLDAHNAGTPFVYFDKGYNRDKKWWRVSYCAHNPTEYLWDLGRSDDRRREQGWEPKSWISNPDGPIILAGSSAKYHELCGLPDPETYWEGVVAELRELTDRKIIYRPKKSYGNARPLPGTEFSKTDTIEEEMKGAYALVTHGSNACFEALLEGCPAIVLGNGVTKDLSSTRISDIDNLLLASHEMKIRILNSLANFQWKIDEIEKGAIWELIDDCEKLRQGL